MGAPTVNPSTHTVVIGFPDGVTITGLYRESVEETTFANIEEIRAEDNSEACSIISGTGSEATVSAIVPGTWSSTPTKGSTITVNAVKWLVTDVREVSSRTLRRLTFTIRKPTEVTYS